MNWFSKFIKKQGQIILQNDMYALFNTLALSILPYTGWLAASVIALITLRKGIQKGSYFLIVAVLMHFFVMSKTPLSTFEALISALLSYLPCYLAAVTLYSTVSWRWVFITLFSQVLLICLILQLFSPEFAIQQYLYVRELLSNVQLGSAINVFSSTKNVSTQTIFAHYLIGTQAAGIILSSLFSLIIARYIQSLIFYPEGFKQEMRMLRGSKTDLAVFAAIFIASQQHYLLAIDILPVVLLLFCIAGLSLWFDFTKKHSMLGPSIVLSVVLFFFPQIMLSIYVLLGAFDSLFNFRLYLHQQTGAKKIREVK